MTMVLSDHDRRRMILEALSAGANTRSRIARAYGIHSNTVHDHINRAVEDPEGRWREAQEGACFRRKVYELLC